MVTYRRFLKGLRDGLVLLAGLAAIALAVRYARTRVDRPASHFLRLSAGQALGVRHRMALRLAVEARGRGVRLNVQPCAGSDEALDLVDAGMLDLAMVQGGLNRGGRRHVRQVATLQVEPLHLLVKGDLFPDVSRNLAALRGKVVNLGEKGSGTARLAREVLTFAGLRAGTGAGAVAEPLAGDFTATALGYEELESFADPAGMPDAIFLVSTLPSRVARHLVARHGYRLVPLPFGEAFALDALVPEADAGVVAPAPGPGTAAVNRIHVDESRIPAFTYGVDPAVPEQAIPTLGTRLLLVAHEATDPRAIPPLLDAIYTSPFAQASRPPLDTSLLELPAEWPPHAGLTAHLDRNKPLIAADLVDLLEKEVSIVGVAAGGLFVLWQWVRRWYRRRRERGLESYLLKVMEIEDRTARQESAPSPSLPELLALQADLGALKGEALRKFAEGEIEGDELISGFLTYANDARESLTRLILHERDHLEDLALGSGTPPEAAWIEAVGDHPGKP